MVKIKATSTKPFKFENNSQSKIYESLKRFIAEAPASFYKDACKIMLGPNDLEAKTNLVSHLLREIYGWILDFMLPAVNYTEPEGDGKYKQKIKDAAGFYKIDESDRVVQLWMKKIAGRNGLHKISHRDSMGELSSPDGSFLEIWEASEIIFEFLLDKIEANYLQYTTQLDHFLGKKTITSADLTKIKTHIPLNQITLLYFFERLEKPECITLLRKKGFFKYPKKIIKHEDGGVSFPHWPQMIYLVKMSKNPEVQDEVLSICLEIETDNINIQVQILEVALNLPADKAVQLVRKTYVWFPQMSSWFHPENYGKLIARLAVAGKISESMELAGKILAVQPSPRKPTTVDGYTFPHDPVALIDDYQYEKILNEDFPQLVESAGFDAVKILLSQIEDYIALSDAQKEKGSKDDYSEIWRPAIEDHSQNHKFGIRDILITGARDVAEQFLSKNPDKILEVIEDLEKRKLNMFSRIAMHLVRIFPKGAEQKITQYLMNKNEFTDRSRLSHEYFLLAESHSKLLNEKQKNEIWSWIMTGADVNSHRKWVKQNGTNPTEEELNKYEKTWQMYHLTPFKDIDPTWQKYYQNLVKELGEPEFPSFRSWTKSGSFGPKSVVSSEQLKTMKPEDVIDYLRNWKPDSNDPFDRSREGTGREITTQIKEDPSRWTESLPMLVDLDPTYVRSVFTGYRDAIKEGKKIDWDKVLDLSLAVLAKPVEIEQRESSSPFGDDPNWNWCRHAIVELITEGLKEVEGQAPIKMRDKLWKVIKELTDDADPTPEHEKEYLASHSDPLSLAINSTRGDSMGAAIQYGVWLKSACTKEEQSSWSIEKEAPELLQVLNSHLDISKDPSLGIRALYGEKLGVLTWLDEKWVEKSQSLIFPSDPKLQKYFDAAWESYITFVNAYDNVFKILKSQYERAVTEIGHHTDNKHHLENPDQNLAHHLIIYYWRGLINLDDKLLGNFYKSASVELKSEIIDFVGRVSKNDSVVPRKVLDRFIALLNFRIAKVKKGKKSDNAKEFESLNWWVASEKFDDEWILNKLLEVLEMGSDMEGDHLAMERFVEIADKFPLQVIKCSRLMVENDKKGWGVLHWRDDLKTVIDVVLKSKNEEARKAAIEFVHRLASRGHIEFKDLINDGDR